MPTIDPASTTLPPAFQSGPSHPGSARVGAVTRAIHSDGAAGRVDAASTSPDDTLERTLLGIWRQILGRPDLDATTTFTDAGGGSLAAMSLLTAIEKQCGFRLQPRTLVTAPSVRHQVELIARMKMASAHVGDLVAIPVQTHGTRPPQFIVPGYGDTLVGIHQLAEALGSDRPFYILDPASYDPAGRGFQTIGELAAEMVAEMQRIRPGGPHHICGHSIGALLVWEIACQLHAAGAKQGAVTLLDCNAPGYPPKVSRPLRWAMKIADAGRHGPAQLASLFSRRWRLGFRDLLDLPPRLFDALQREQLGTVAAELERQWMATYRLCTASSAQFYEGKAHLVRATIRRAEIGARDDDPQLGWGRYARNPLTVLPLASDHWQILDPRHAQALSVLLRRAILA